MSKQFFFFHSTVSFKQDCNNFQGVVANLVLMQPQTADWDRKTHMARLKQSSHTQTHRRYTEWAWVLPQKKKKNNQKKLQCDFSRRGNGLTQVVQSWTVGSGRNPSVRAESLSCRACRSTAIGSPTCPQEETVLDCRSRCARALP